MMCRRLQEVRVEACRRLVVWMEGKVGMTVIVEFGGGDEGDGYQMEEGDEVEWVWSTQKDGWCERMK